MSALIGTMIEKNTDTIVEAATKSVILFADSAAFATKVKCAVAALDRGVPSGQAARLRPPVHDCGVSDDDDDGDGSFDETWQDSEGNVRTTHWSP